MRLGCDFEFFVPQTIHEFETVCERLDKYGLSAVTAPTGFADWSIDQAQAYGEAAVAHGLVVGEAGYWQNLSTSVPELQASRIATVRRMLLNAEAMGCRCVVTLAGTQDASAPPLAPSREMLGRQGARLLRETVLRALATLLNPGPTPSSLNQNRSSNSSSLSATPTSASTSIR